MTRWRSSAVAVATIGAAGVAGCSPCEDYLRNSYASDADCQRDYAGACMLEQDNGVTTIVGPWYRANRREPPEKDPGPGATAVNGRSQVATGIKKQARRAGFGSNGATTRACS
jgi:hypothetical protein